ncbi:hypothetical protein CTM55_03940 [Prevotella intermedia]|nr:hypothetical protein CTM55_03940 [Prevotella intermedia]
MHGKSGCFAMQNSRFRNVKTQLPLFNEIIFTKQGRISVFVFSKKRKANAQIRLTEKGYTPYQHIENGSNLKT